MKKYLKSSLFILFILSLTNTYLYSATLTDNINNYSLTYPDSWTAKKYPNSNNLVKGDISKGNQAGINIRIYPKNTSFSSFIDPYLENFQKDMSTHWKGGMNLIEEESITINGQICYTATFDFKRNDGSRWILKQYLIPRDEQTVFVFQSGTKYETKDTNIPIIDKIIQSIRLH